MFHNGHFNVQTDRSLTCSALKEGPWEQNMNELKQHCKEEGASTFHTMFEIVFFSWLYQLGIEGDFWLFFFYFFLKPQRPSFKGRCRFYHEKSVWCRLGQSRQNQPGKMYIINGKSEWGFMHVVLLLNWSCWPKYSFQQGQPLRIL